MKLPVTWLFVSTHNAGQLSAELRAATLEFWTPPANLLWMLKVN